MTQPPYSGRDSTRSRISFVAFEEVQPCASWERTSEAGLALVCAPRDAHLRAQRSLRQQLIGARMREFPREEFGNRSVDRCHEPEAAQDAVTQLVGERGVLRRREHAALSPDALDSVEQRSELADEFRH
eukprot:6186212-Pleurochrysis_carterae.AAC.2